MSGGMHGAYTQSILRSAQRLRGIVSLLPGATLRQQCCGGRLPLQPALLTSPLRHGFASGTLQDVAAKQRMAPRMSAAATADLPAVDPNSARVIDTELRTEAEQSYLAYAMSVIVGRALPDVRDGLKPVHRRILYAMHDLGLVASKPHRKCARVVGEVLGKYHPHGDTAVYNALVRLAQDFSMQAPLISGHGNFGSLDNDPAAAMRYTECRLQQLSSSMLLADLDDQIIQYVPNFDESQEEPTVLPARLPNLLVNGSSGIAVGIATNIPPHNLREVVDGLCALIHDPDITVKQLMQHIPGPDFPTGGEILMTDGIRGAYHEGRGSITMRAKVQVVEEETSARGKSKRGLIVISELPYQTNKADLVASIADLVNKDTISGIADVRDESDRSGMRVVVEVKKGSSPQVILNNLYKHTSLQSRFACNMVALVNGTPLSLDLKQFLSHFLEFRCKIVRKRAERDLLRAQTRQHLVEGFLLAMRDLDKVVDTIRKASDGAQATADLQAAFQLSPTQADGVLNLPLRRLTSLEDRKLQDENATLTSRIVDLEDLLQKPERVLEVVETEARELAAKFGVDRRSLLAVQTEERVSDIAFVPNEPSFVTFSKRGYIKRMRSDTFTVQGRGGRGMKGATLKGDDSMAEVLHVMDHDDILFFTKDGSARNLKAYQVPEASRTAAGSAITQVLPLKKSDSIAALLSVSKFKTDDFLVMLTKNGLIKRTPLADFETIRSNGISAMKLKAGDELRWVAKCKEGDTVCIAASNGQLLAIAVTEKGLKPQMRAGGGSRGMRFAEGAYPIGLTVLSAKAAAGNGEGPWLLFASAQGYGKRVLASAFSVKGRGTAGMLGMKLRDDDRLVDIHLVGHHADDDGEEVVFVSSNGLISRTLVSSIAVQSRSAKGVNILNLKDGDELQTVTTIKTPKASRGTTSSQSSSS